MNQNLCRSFATAVLLGTVGIPLSANAEQLSQETFNFQEAVELTADSSSESVVESVLPSQDVTELAPDSDALSAIFEITAHTLNDIPIAVLRVDTLPVFKFVAQGLEPSSGVKEETPQTFHEMGDPVARAEQVALQIDQYYRESGDPANIHVRWDEDVEEYVISLEGETLVLINDATYYANTTGEHSQDALHATNRLRTLLGGADPLTDVEGRPEPQTVAARSNWDVTSMFTGQASWYGPGFHGRHTASGEVFNQNALTAAHRTLPFGTQVRVTNIHNNRQVVVRINDRGPFSRGRVIDLSAGAARSIGLDRAGVGPVRVEVLSN